MPFVAKADDLIAGRYLVLRPIGEGGMGGVWEATDQVLGCPIALKVVPEKHLMGDRAQQVQRFLREARLAAQVQHPAVVRVTDFGVHEDTPYIAMELLEGESLADRMYRTPQLEIDEAVQISIGILRGLGAAHAAGVVHRDIKPENVQLVSTVEGLYPKLIDFGISLGTDQNNQRISAVTTNGHIFGTPLYMSPEHVRGSDIDGRADLYSLGIVLYEMLARQAPFDAKTAADMMAAVVRDVPMPPCEVRPTLPSRLSDVVMKALSKDPDDRYADANEMAKALAAAAPGIRLDATGPVTIASGVHRISNERPSQMPTLAPPPKRRLGVALFLSLIAICVGGVIVELQTEAIPITTKSQSALTSDENAEDPVVAPEPEIDSAPEAAVAETIDEVPHDPAPSEQVEARRVRARSMAARERTPLPRTAMSSMSFRQLDY